MKTKTAFVLSVLLAAALALPVTAEVLLSKDDAVKQLFPDADKTEEKEVTITDAHKKNIKDTYGWDVTASSIAVRESSRSGKIIGRTVFIPETGKHGKIWVAVGVKTDGTIARAAVCSLSEVRGKPVAKDQFLKQFNGKSLNDSFTVGKGVQAVSGATTSSKSVAAAVKKGSILLNTLFSPSS